MFLSCPESHHSPRQEYGLMSLTMNRVIEAVITFALAELWVSFGWNKSGISVGVFVLAVLASPSLCI